MKRMYVIISKSACTRAWIANDSYDNTIIPIYRSRYQLTSRIVIFVQPIEIRNLQWPKTRSQKGDTRRDREALECIVNVGTESPTST